MVILSLYFVSQDWLTMKDMMQTWICVDIMSLVVGSHSLYQSDQNEIIWGYKNLDYHWHHCQFVFSPHITKIWLLTHKNHIEKKKKCRYLRFNPIDIFTTMPIVTQKPKTNGQFLAPSDNATAIIDLPTTGGFTMNFYFSFLTSLFCSFNMWNKN